MKDEKKLKEILTEKTPNKFEENFWSEFDKSFKEDSVAWYARFELVGAAMAAGIALVVYFNSINTQQIDTMTLASNIELIENYEMLDDLDEELLDLSDEEWEVVLADN